MPEGGSHYEHEPLTPEQMDALRVDIVLHLVEYGPGPIYAIGIDTGNKMIDTIEALKDMEARGELVRTPHDDIFGINPETQAQTYADVLPRISAEQLAQLATIGNRRPRTFGTHAKEIKVPLQIAVGMEQHARAAKLGRLTTSEAA